MKNSIDMKKIFLGVVSLLLIGAAASSCTKFLEEPSKTEITLPDYFRIADHARASVNVLYNTTYFRNFYGMGNYAGNQMAYGNYLSGFFDNPMKGQERIGQDCQSLTISPIQTNGEMRGIFQRGYENIGNANSAIRYIPGIEDDSFTAGEKERLIAEAKFYRATSYFMLVKFFGDVPMRLEPFESMDEAYRIPDTPSADIYAQIIKDLTEAIPDLPGGKTFVANGYRITKELAQAYLANVYLTMSGYPMQNNNYANAAAAARSVIQSGVYSLTANLDTGMGSAYNLLRTERELLPEIMHVREFSSTDSSWSSWTQATFPRGASSWGVFKYNEVATPVLPLPEFIWIYDPDNDLRIGENQFFHTKYTYKKIEDKVEVTYDVDFATMEGATKGFWAPWFWYDEEALLESGHSQKDAIIMRYPEVLLTAAEAIAKSEGVTAEAVGYLADVRARAYTKMTRDGVVASLTGLSADNFVKEVWTERLREFPLEFKIWDDMQRTRMYPVTSETNKGTVGWTNIIGATNPWGATFTEKYLLWPISFNEMQRNPLMTQTPGYE
jgi:hypothetical protein